MALCLVGALIIFIGILIAEHSPKEFSPLEKVGKVKDIRWEQLIWWEPNKPKITILEFEEGDVIAFMGQVEDVEIGKTYRIVYHQQREYFRGEWSGKYHVVDSIEEVK